MRSRHLALDVRNRTHDFQVVIVGRPGQTSTVQMFYEFETPGSSPK